MTDFVDPFEALGASGKSRPLKVVPASRPALTREEYVEREVEVTRRRFAGTGDLDGRLRRSRDYALWRWDGVQAGEVESL